MIALVAELVQAREEWNAAPSAKTLRALELAKLKLADYVLDNQEKFLYSEGVEEDEPVTEEKQQHGDAPDSPLFHY